MEITSGEKDDGGLSEEPLNERRRSKEGKGKEREKEEGRDGRKDKQDCMKGDVRPPSNPDSLSLQTKREEVQIHRSHRQKGKEPAKKAVEKPHTMRHRSHRFADSLAGGRKETCFAMPKQPMGTRPCEVLHYNFLER